MFRKRLFLHGIFLFLLPVLVAAFGLGVVTASLLVAAMLLWRWLIVVSGIWAPEKTADIVLDTISASHFVEKVRWCMDRLGVDYTERQSAGTLGVFFTGRTVPRLRVRTGLVESVIGNSPEILRYLWGAYGAAAFLEPTEARVELEGCLDRYGRSLQVWIYYHMLRDRQLTLQAWGANSPYVPGWQRRLLGLLFPLQAALIRRAFGITDDHYAKSVLRIEELLSDVDTRLADGRTSILGEEEINYTDLAFAAFTGLWLQPQGYGGVKGQYVRIERARLPGRMRADIERWIEDFPRATRFVEALYRDQRGLETS
ncbi:MAG TPA: hypothetical protein VLA06_07140 [Woeseiaceae bacterium]|jgi:glutathione S-transferase|nr:hypothetical protein [Woeseiaceae bacterium]